MARRLGSSSMQGAHQVAQRLRTTMCPRSLLRSTVRVASETTNCGAGLPMCPGWSPRSQPETRSIVRKKLVQTVRTIGSGSYNTKS